MGNSELATRVRRRGGDVRTAKDGRRNGAAGRSAAEREGVRLAGAAPEGTEGVLTPEALGFVAALEREFRTARDVLLERRRERRREIDGGARPGFLAATAAVRAADWSVAPAPADLEDRRVEIGGPTDRRTVIHALNSGAPVFLADFEDGNSPTFGNMARGQLNLRDAVAGTILDRDAAGREYRLVARPAAIAVRPRGLHLEERHLVVDGRPVAATVFDAGLFLFHSARPLVDRGATPHLCVPKLESHLEARFLNDLLRFAEERLRLPRGAIRVTVLVETVFAAFEMDEILYELRERAVALAAGRADYLFHAIRTFRNHRSVLFPDRGRLTGRVPFLAALSELLLRTAHRRGVHAIGGTADAAPGRRDPTANVLATWRLREDAGREVRAGFDGVRVGHPDLVPRALAVVERGLPDAPHQKHVLRTDTWITGDDLLDFRVAGAGVTEEELVAGLEGALRWLEGWLGGRGAVALRGRIVDTAAAELAFAQVRHWIHHEAGVLDDGRKVTADLVRSLLARVADRAGAGPGEPPANGTLAAARGILERLAFAPGLGGRLTTVAAPALAS